VKQETQQVTSQHVVYKKQQKERSMCQSYEWW
jgi:hypothetical protein